MSTFNPDDVYRLGHRILTTINTAAVAVSGTQLPARQALSTGGATYDCEMVSVSAITIQTGFPENQGGGGGSKFTDGSYTYPEANITIWTCKYELAIVRCAQERYDGRNPPKVDWIQADLMAASSDAAVLIEAVELLVKSMDTPIPHNPLTFLQPEGQLIATRLQITVPVWPDAVAPGT